MKKILSLAAMLLVAWSAVHAYSFKSGELCYNITSNNTVAVTFERNTDLNSSLSAYSNLGGELIIPETVYNGGRAYSVTAITDYAFYRCNLITSISIPKTIQTIGIFAFYNTNATSITFGSGSVLTEIGQQAFDLASFTSVSIPNSVTTIGNSAFSRSALVTANIPTSIQNLGTGVFSSSSSLRNVTLPNGLQEIPQNMFGGCSSLTSINLPASLTTINRSAFRASGLTSITIPNGVTTIDQSAFDESQLTRVTIPSSVTTIGYDAFRKTKLTSVTIPSSITSIGSDAFGYITTLKTANIQNSIISEKEFSYCTNLKEVTIGNNVTTIGNKPFQGCTSLETLNISSSVAVDINQYFSDNKPTLKTVKVENTVTTIPENAFLNFVALEKVTIPATITSIGNSAFKGCTAMREFYSLMDRPITIDASVFQDVPVDGYCDLHVPTGSKVRYQNKAVWKDFVMIFEDAGSGGGGSTSGVRGDVNDDGKVDIADVNIVINLMLGKDN